MKDEMKTQVRGLIAGLVHGALTAIVCVQVTRAAAQPPPPPAPPPLELPAIGATPAAALPPTAPQGAVVTTNTPAKRPINVRAMAQRPSPLVWDAMVKNYTAKPGEITNMFTFSVTNISKSVVYIDQMRPSCGCTVAKLPQQPWRLDPGSNGVTYVTVNFAGKYGLLTKSIAVSGSELGATPSEPTQKLTQTLLVKINIPMPTNSPAMAKPVLARGGAMDRNANIDAARFDRQAVFKGECASCHAATALGKTGEPLFHAVCGVCHESPQRATMVPDLAVAKVRRDETYWKSWIKFGKGGTLMPGFLNSGAVGGPLTPEQIQSLVDFLVQKYPVTPQVLR